MKNMKEFISRSLADTQGIAKRLAATLKGNEIIVLHGGLGAGKTAFCKALAKALGVKEVVTSPTFTFLKCYQGRFPFYHFDLYRAESEDEVVELGLREYIGKGVCAIEWNKFGNLGEVTEISITVDEHTGIRYIKQQVTCCT